MTQTPEAQDELYRSPVETAIDLAQELLHKPLPPNTEDKMHNKNASEIEAQAACEILKRVIEAAENSNQAGENAAVIAAAAVTASHTSPKDPGLIASEADFLNTELRMANRDHEQVEPDDDWRSSIRGLVEGVRAGEEFNRRNRKMLAISEEAWVEVCDHVKRAEGMLRALVTGNKYKEEK